MKRLFLSLLVAISLPSVAQTADPVVMTVNGKPVTRSEFEYAYNKNRSVEGAVEQKSVEEYAEMFLNYRLKVEAALDARLDTLSSLKKEFLTYRDMQLMPFLVDSLYVDSVARSLYDASVERLGGRDLLRTQHILVRLDAAATEAQKQAAQRKADSLYRAIMGGADFDKTARESSDDPGSAPFGGLLPWIGPGSTVQEFEDAAYALEVGQVSEPVLSPYGYHIVKMKERKKMEPYEVLRPSIVNALKQQGVEDASAQARLKKLVAASNGKRSSEEILDSVRDAHIATDLELRYLIQEYHDGLLLYEVSQNEVWKPSASDETGQQAYYKANKKKYAWTEPRFAGYVVQAKNAALLKEATKFVKKHKGESSLSDAVKERFNADSTTVVLSKPLLVKKGENRFVDQHVFGGKAAKPSATYPFFNVIGKKQKQPKSLDDVRQQVLTDYQDMLEKEWVARLRQKYPYEINRDVLATINNH